MNNDPPRRKPLRSDPRRPGRGLSRPDYADRRKRYENRERRRAARLAPAPRPAHLAYSRAPDLCDLRFDPVEDAPRTAPTPEAAAEQRQEQAETLAKARFDRICQRQRRGIARAGVPKYPKGQRAYWRAQRIRPGSGTPLLAPRVTRVFKQRHASATVKVPA